MRHAGTFERVIANKRDLYLRMTVLVKRNTWVYIRSHCMMKAT